MSLGSGEEESGAHTTVLSKPSPLARCVSPPAERISLAPPNSTHPTPPTAGLFSGSAMYISAVEHPGLLADDPSGKLASERFTTMYSRAAPIQGTIALIGGAAAAVAAANGGHCSKVLWGGSGALLLSVWPWTLIAMVGASLVVAVDLVWLFLTGLPRAHFCGTSSHFCAAASPQQSIVSPGSLHHTHSPPATTALSRPPVPSMANADAHQQEAPGQGRGPHGGGKGRAGEEVGAAAPLPHGGVGDVIRGDGGGARETQARPQVMGGVRWEGGGGEGRACARRGPGWLLSARQLQSETQEAAFLCD